MEAVEPGTGRGEDQAGLSKTMFQEAGAWAVGHPVRSPSTRSPLLA